MHVFLLLFVFHLELETNDISIQTKPNKTKPNQSSKFNKNNFNAFLKLTINLTEAYYILDELIIGGQLSETSKREVLRVTAAQDELVENDLKNETPMNRLKLSASSYHLGR